MKMNEEQFFDAVDTALDFEDENDDDLVSCSSLCCTVNSFEVGFWISGTSTFH